MTKNSAAIKILTGLIFCLSFILCLGAILKYQHALKEQKYLYEKSKQKVSTLTDENDMLKSSIINNIDYMTIDYEKIPLLDLDGKHVRMHEIIMENTIAIIVNSGGISQKYIDYIYNYADIMSDHVEFIIIVFSRTFNQGKYILDFHDMTEKTFILVDREFTNVYDDKIWAVVLDKSITPISIFDLNSATSGELDRFWKFADDLQ